jgi:2-(1,2-epoxy-1,2-dihydrophenyl)acetyl-CoA isomerase
MAEVQTERDGAVLVVTLNRPDAMNAMDRALLDQLSGAWHEASAPEVRAVVVTGAGKGFSAGADLKGSGGGDPALSGLRHTYNTHVLGLHALEKPVIAAVNGAAAGAGLSLACAADIRIASEAAKFVPAFAKIGLVPDAGGTWFIPRILGYSRAFEWLLTARPLLAPEALEWGLVSRVVPAAELLPTAVELAQQLAAVPGAAIALAKPLLQRAADWSLAEALEAEARTQPIAIAHPDRAAARAAVVSQISSSKPS